MQAIVSAVMDTKESIQNVGLETLQSFLASISQSVVAFDFYRVCRQCVF